MTRYLHLHSPHQNEEAQYSKFDAKIKSYDGQQSWFVEDDRKGELLSSVGGGTVYWNGSDE